MVTDPPVHAAFYDRSLGGLAADGGFDRVLISGSADYAILAQVLAAYWRQGAEPDVTNIDRCETPLFLCRWYAERAGATVATAATDILDFHSARPFDVICSHSFLGYFSPGQRTRLIAKWHNLLRPGGKVVTVHRIRPSDAPDKAGFSSEQVDAFAARAHIAATASPTLFDLTPEAIADLARSYARQFTEIRSIRSLGEIIDLFDSGGFELDHPEIAEARPGSREPASGVSTPEGASYALIVATRR